MSLDNKSIHDATITIKVIDIANTSQSVLAPFTFMVSQFKKWAKDLNR